MVNTADNWIEQLKSPDEEVRRIAVTSLADNSHDSVLELLDQALGDESWRVRKAAVQAFRAFPDRGLSARALINALTDPDNAGRRTAAMEALISMGKEATSYLLDSVRHPDEDVRKFIVDILGEIKDSRAVEALLPLTRDPAENIKLAAIEALGSIGGDQAFEELLILLASDNVSVQFGVLHALSQIGNPIPLASIRPLLSKKILRRAIYDALGHTRDLEAVNLIVDGLTDSGKSARQAAARALHRLATDSMLEAAAEQAVKKRLARESLAPFAEFIEGNHIHTKRATIKLLSMIGTPEAMKILIRAADDDTVQVEVTEAISRIKDKVPETVEVIQKEGQSISREVIEALKEAPPSARKALGPMTDDQFQRVRELVSRESGLFYDYDLKYLVERRMQRRMESLSLFDYDDYMDMIEGNGSKGLGERKNLINSLSTNETYFFREDFQLRAFEEEILPSLIKEKERTGSRRIRVWSAGCSSGEETYTIAILVKETQGLSNFKVEILGSDINEKMIEQARAALYNPSSFRTTPDSYLDKYFVREGSRFRLVDEIRGMVEFDATNILSCGQASHLAGLDVIFCRNVIIYFGSEAKRLVVDQFYDLLNPGGYLLLGHSESLMSISTQFELVHLKNDLVYRKGPRESSP